MKPTFFGFLPWTDTYEPTNTPALLGSFLSNEQVCFFYEMFGFYQKPISLWLITPYPIAVHVPCL